MDQLLLPPKNSEEILFNPDAPSHVWYEVHGLRLTETTATSEAQKGTEPEVSKDSGEILQESEEVATKYV